MRRILLVEPGYRNKYPPLGLMKISSYHKRQGDLVKFVKGCVPEVRQERWDRIYVASLFTFFWRETTTTIEYYLRSTDSPGNVVVGGILATLMGDELERTFPIRVVRGVLDRPGALDPGSRIIIDHLIPDYRILQTIDYKYGVEDAYFGYATRGCPNKCSFCAVPRLEPEFIHHMPLRHQVRGIEDVYGTKQHLLLLDNNVLASTDFEQIITEIRDLGFERGAKHNGRQRCLDFNQGVDARRLTREKMRLLSTTALTPMRLALDDSRLLLRYESCVKLAAEFGMLKHSTYVLYNHQDTPADFYRRLRAGVALNDKLGTKISSFPMRYIPLTSKDRKYVGPHWSKRLVHGIQCILLATRGMVTPHRQFFDAAFGESADDMMRIALMPEPYIIWRRLHEKDAAAEWSRLYRQLTPSQMGDFRAIVGAGKVTPDIVAKQSSVRLKRILTHYVEAETPQSRKRPTV